jgi:predicted nucleotidyltransferase
VADSLASLEQQRSALLSQFLDLGDFRRGSITAIQGRCGKPNCHCHLPDQPAHGPNFRLTFKVSGKTISETFSSPAEMRKAEREVDTFHRFQQLSQQLLEVNEKICRARPVDDLLTPEEKKRPKRSSAKRPRK